MRHRSFIAVVVVLALLAVAAGGVLVLDARAKDHIAEGVRVGGVDLSGMTAAQARTALHNRLLAPLQSPVVVRHGSRAFHLSAREAHIHANIAGMVDEAMASSRRGSVLTRAWRELRGTRVNASLPGRVAFSRRAVTRLVTRVEQKINQQPRDAHVEFSGSGLKRVPGVDGLALNAQSLEDRIMASVAKPGAPRSFTATTRRVAPKVTTEQLARRYDTVVIIDRGAFTLRLYKQLQFVKSYPVAVGQQGLETPAGLYSIQDKQVNPSWHVPNSPWAGKLAGKVIPPGPDDPIKARWMGFNGGAGIHGTDEPASIGSAASHGCVRMRIPDVIDLYPRVPMGAAVYVA